MSNDFKQISTNPGFMKHNGGLMFRNVSENRFEFKSKINEKNLNAAGITHGGYIAAIIDAGAGTAAHRVSGKAPCVTISLELKFISASREGDEIIGSVNILKKTKTLVFLNCELKSKDTVVASASGIWKILKIQASKLGPGG
jgi:uncharacterized protein (TIGR00369 family)